MFDPPLSLCYITTLLYSTIFPRLKIETFDSYILQNCMFVFYSSIPGMSCCSARGTCMLGAHYHLLPIPSHTHTHNSQWCSDIRTLLVQYLSTVKNVLISFLMFSFFLFQFWINIIWRYATRVAIIGVIQIGGSILPCSQLVSCGLHVFCRLTSKHDDCDAKSEVIKDQVFNWFLRKLMEMYPK